MIQDYCRCVKCGEPMIGITSYEARDTCEGCGGRSLKNPPKEPKYRKIPKSEGDAA